MIRIKRVDEYAEHLDGNGRYRPMIAEFVIKNFTRYFIVFIPEMKTLTRFKL